MSMLVALFESDALEASIMLKQLTALSALRLSAASRSLRQHVGKAAPAAVLTAQCAKLGWPEADATLLGVSYWHESMAERRHSLPPSSAGFCRRANLRCSVRRAVDMLAKHQAPSSYLESPITK